MAVIAVVNRKGGSGKSTLATHIACYMAMQGLDVMLGDVDRQQSSRLWLSLRPESRPKILGWTIDDRNFARPPAGVKHVVLDTPGGFQGVGLMKVALYADAILIPTTPSLFDRESAADCLKELRIQPRVITGKCRVAGIGMRIDGRTRNAEQLQGWAAGLGLTHLGTIREAQAYARCMEQGMSIFDMPPAKVATYLPEWSPVSAWIDQVLAGPQVLEPAEPERRGIVSRVVPATVVAPTVAAQEAPAFLRT
ncbi:MAG TPA: ParA family protein [Burkholderiales bacterium]|jgi:chromosome partitioning protein|nr:ParA family protein [Burkholderiales bacterium]